MNHTSTHTILARRALMLLGATAALATAVACSSNSKPAGTAASPVPAVVRPAALQTIESASPQPAPVAVSMKSSTPVKPPASKLLVYRSRDYAVSFVYPWQYAFLSARALVNGNASLRPKTDGHDGQVTLARIDIPKGYYPDTDFENGYFVLGLNPNLNQQECEATLTAADNGKMETDNVNGVDFRWVETDTVGHGSSSRVRNYVAFTNATCYELEMGVKTSNPDGLAREVDPELVLRRLDAILRTVKILPATTNPPAVATSTPAAAPAAQN